jgi:hypothetical protein
MQPCDVQELFRLHTKKLAEESQHEMMKSSDDNENKNAVEKNKMMHDNLHKRKLTASSPASQFTEMNHFQASLNFKHGLEELVWQYT